MSTKRFCGGTEFGLFLVYFTFLLVVAPMIIGVKLALADQVAPIKHIEQKVLDLPGCLMPYRLDIVCRFGRLY